jgi:hypothetical protein
LLVHLSHLHALQIGPRNGLLLSIVNSMTVFGNNTLAVAMVILIPALIAAWNRKPDWRFMAIAALFFSLLAGYSITLIFTVCPALLLWLLAGRIRKPLFAAAIVAVVFIVVVGIMAVGLHMFASGRQLVIAWDRGQYLRHIAVVMLPLWVIAFACRNRWRQFGLFWLLIGMGIVVPTLLYIPASVTGNVDFSMKTATLIAAAAVPMVFAGLLELQAVHWRRPLAIAAAALIATGLACSAAYAAQFGYLRLRGNQSRTLSLPTDYVLSLEWIRDHTPSSAVVIDPGALEVAQVIPTVMLAERTSYLPTSYTADTLTLPAMRVLNLEARAADFDDWRAGGFSDPILSARFARAGDFLILPRPAPTDGNWRQIAAFGAYTVAESRHARP